MGTVYYRGINGSDKVKAGSIWEEEDVFVFQYAQEYLCLNGAQAVSLTLPLQEQAFTGSRLFSFFDGLIPEGWLLETAQRNWKLNSRDRMGLLLVCCKDTIGAVTVEGDSHG
jgi:serine/threonine-protein kinase HipA